MKVTINKGRRKEGKERGKEVVDLGRELQTIVMFAFCLFVHRRDRNRKDILDPGLDNRVVQ